jgi:DNA-directed RNA polymerase subunit beta'
LAGKETVQRYIIKEVQNIYTSQGEGINDKYIEIIIRQMFSRVKVLDSGDTNLIVGEIVERGHFLEENETVGKKGGRLAKAQDLIMGISRVSLSTTSWLSAASFQETAKVLIDAAVQGKEDKLKGLKENVIIGKLIPAGTGLKRDFAQ